MGGSSRDLSSLLFSNRRSERLPPIPIVGPVEISKNVVHGRGLIASRDVIAGECLFVTDPAAYAPVAGTRSRWHQCDDGRSLELVAEKVLIEEMKKSMASDSTAEKSKAGSFLLLFGEGGDTFGDGRDSLNSKGVFETFLGNTQPEKRWFEKVNDETLLGIVRRNAFGPDYKSYDAMEDLWGQEKSELEDCPILFKRILGLYPLAAAINHSCSPNAVKVFVSETMMVHASMPIKKGEEILWSYIPPTQTYGDRQTQLLSKYKFRCRCIRCCKEDSIFAVEDDLREKFLSLDKLNLPNMAGLDSVWTAEDFSSSVDKIEELLKHSRLSNEIRHYLRVGYTNLYLNHFNTTLSKISRSQLLNVWSIREKILTLAMQLHFAFASCHNASTEHLSILHLCYELISLIYSVAKVSFEACIISYFGWPLPQCAPFPAASLRRCCYVSTPPLLTRIQTFPKFNFGQSN